MEVGRWKGGGRREKVEEQRRGKEERVVRVERTQTDRRVSYNCVGDVR